MVACGTLSVLLEICVVVVVVVVVAVVVAGVVVVFVVVVVVFLVEVVVEVVVVVVVVVLVVVVAVVVTVAMVLVVVLVVADVELMSSSVVVVRSHPHGKSKSLSGRGALGFPGKTCHLAALNVAHSVPSHTKSYSPSCMAFVITSQSLSSRRSWLERCSPGWEMLTK
jgi:energy-coupling factor transporter transmembrane protein EcfT